MTSAGLAELAYVADRAGYQKIRPARASPHIARVLKIVHFETLFQMDQAKK
jgi:hypothetical protein